MKVNPRDLFQLVSQLAVGFYPHLCYSILAVHVKFHHWMIFQDRLIKELLCRVMWTTNQGEITHGRPFSYT